MKISNLILIVLVLVSSIDTNIKKNESDLKVLKIETPEWENNEKRTKVAVTIQNKGKARSLPCRAMLYDLDLSVEQGKALGLDELHLDLLAENNGRTSYKDDDEFSSVDGNSYDYDKDFAVFVNIPPLKPKEMITLTFYIQDIWVYNSNCELRVILDIDQTNNESNRENNWLDFFAWG